MKAVKRDSQSVYFIDIWYDTQSEICTLKIKSLCQWIFNRFFDQSSANEILLNAIKQYTDIEGNFYLNESIHYITASSYKWLRSDNYFPYVS